MTLSRFRILKPRSMVSALLALVGASSLFAGSALYADETPAKRADAAALTTPMAVYWKYTSSYSPSVSGTPILSDGVLYFASANRVFAINPQTGSLKWRYPADAPLTTVITGALTLNKGTLYFSAGDGLYAIDAVDGKLKWPRYSVRIGVSTSPVVVGDRVYFGSSDAKLYALQADKGEPVEGIWSSAKSVGISAGGEFIGDIAAVNDMLYYVTADQVIHAVNSATGQQRWGYRMTSNLTEATPVINGEYLYLSAGDALTVFRLTSGQPRWTVKLGSDAAVPPVVDTDGTAYVINADRYMLAIDVRGRYLWKKAPHLDNEAEVAPVIAGDMLFVGTTLGGVYAYDKASGTLKWRFVVKPNGAFATTIPINANITAPPLVDGNALYVFSDDGTLTAFRSDASDQLPPTVMPLTPEQGEELNGRPPFYISALVSDEGSGLDVSTLSVKLDNKPVPRKPDALDAIDKPGFTFDEDNGYLQYLISESDGGRNTTLTDGVHTVLISIKDYRGNLVTKTWTFHVDEASTRRSHRFSGGSKTPAGTAPAPATGPGRNNRGNRPRGGRGGGFGGG